MLLPHPRLVLTSTAAHKRGVANYLFYPLVSPSPLSLLTHVATIELGVLSPVHFYVLLIILISFVLSARFFVSRFASRCSRIVLPFTPWSVSCPHLFLRFTCPSIMR